MMFGGQRTVWALTGSLFRPAAEIIINKISYSLLNCGLSWVPVLVQGNTRIRAITWGHPRLQNAVHQLTVSAWRNARQWPMLLPMTRFAFVQCLAHENITPSRYSSEPLQMRRAASTYRTTFSLSAVLLGSDNRFVAITPVMTTDTEWPSMMPGSALMVGIGCKLGQRFITYKMARYYMQDRVTFKVEVDIHRSLFTQILSGDPMLWNTRQQQQ